MDRRILLIDFEEGRLLETKGMLERAGYAVDGVADRASLQAAIAEGLPPIVILEPAICGIDGLALIPLIKSRAHPNRSPVIVVASYHLRNPADQRRALDTGATMCLARPEQDDMLLSVIEGCIGEASPEASSGSASIGDLTPPAAALPKGNPPGRSGPAVPEELDQRIDLAFAEFQESPGDSCLVVPSEETPAASTTSTPTALASATPRASAEVRPTQAAPAQPAAAVSVADGIDVDRAFADFEEATDESCLVVALDEPSGPVSSALAPSAQASSGDSIMHAPAAPVKTSVASPPKETAAAPASGASATPVEETLSVPASGTAATPAKKKNTVAAPSSAVEGAFVQAPPNRSRRAMVYLGLAFGAAGVLLLVRGLLPQGSSADAAAQAPPAIAQASVASGERAEPTTVPAEPTIVPAEPTPAPAPAEVRTPEPITSAPTRQAGPQASAPAKARTPKAAARTESTDTKPSAAGTSAGSPRNARLASTTPPPMPFPASTPPVATSETARDALPSGGTSREASVSASSTRLVIPEKGERSRSGDDGAAETAPSSSLPSKAPKTTAARAEPSAASAPATEAAPMVQPAPVVESVPTEPIAAMPDGSDAPPPESKSLPEAPQSSAPTESTTATAATPAAAEEKGVEEREPVLMPGIAGVSRPELIAETKVAPVFPHMARRLRVSSRVVLQAVILRDGTVGSIKVLDEPRPNLGLADAAIAAVRQWRYRPAMQEGRPVNASLTVSIDFSH